MTAPPAKQLGQTQDPTELVPGDPESVTAVATQFRDLHERTDGAFDTFNRALVPGWEGLSADRYETRHGEERERWKLMLQLADTCATALTTYSAALATAQARARTALETWNEGEQLRRQALADWESERTAWNDAVREQRPFDQMPPHPGHVPPDPGSGKRQEAEELLARARADLEEAGQTACVALGREDGSRTTSESSWFGAEGNVSGPSFSWDAFSESFGSSPGDGVGRDFEDGAFTLGTATGSAWVYRAQGGWEDYWGGTRMNADGTFTLAGVDGNASAGVDRDGARVNLSGNVTVVGAEGEVGGQYGFAEGSLAGNAAVEANAEGKALISQRGAHASGELFAGARAGAEAEGDIGGVGGTVGVEGWAGAGIGGDFNVGFESGKFTIGGSGGIAWGLGGKVSGEITLDFPKMLETGQDIYEGIGDWLTR